MLRIVMRWVLLMALPVLVGCGSVGAKLERYEYRRLCMGVEARVVVFAPGEEAAAEGARAAYARIAELEQVCSDYRPGSEVMRLCARAGQGPVEVSADLFEVLRVAGEVHDATGGAFDPSVGELSVLWRGARAGGALPGDGAIAAARERCGWEKVALDAEKRAVTIAAPGVRIDLGGIAKGYAAAEAVRTLRGAGLSRVMVALAGDVAVGEAPPGEKGWRVEINPGMGGMSGRVEVVRNASVSTSGDREQFVEVGGVRYSHILDPRTGVGLTRRVAAGVVSRDGAVADAVATGLCAMEPGADGLAVLLRARVLKESGTKVWVWRE